jgi:hypothetical protein
MPSEHVVSIAPRWWRFAVRVASSLASPRTDIDRVDAAFDRAISGSALVSLGRRGCEAFESAWRASSTRSVVFAVVRATAPDLPGRTRIGGAVAVVAAAVAVGGDALRSTGRTPLGWVVPVAAAAAGVAAFVAARWLARAIEDRRA